MNTDILPESARHSAGNPKQHSRIAALNRAASVDAFATYRDTLNAFARGEISWSDVVAQLPAAGVAHAR